MILFCNNGVDELIDCHIVNIRAICKDISYVSFQCEQSGSTHDIYLEVASVICKRDIAPNPIFLESQNRVCKQAAAISLKVRKPEKKCKKTGDMRLQSLLSWSELTMPLASSN